MKSRFCEKATGAEEEPEKGPGKNQPQNLLQPVDAVDTQCGYTTHSVDILAVDTNSAGLQSYGASYS